MNTFTLHLQSALQYEHFDDVISFVGEDSSGSFGLMSGHARMMTCLKFGLMRFTHANSVVEYVAAPGGVIYFIGNQLFISTRHYFRSKNYEEIVDALTNQLRAEENTIKDIKETLSRLDENILQRLWKMKREGQL